METIVQDKRDDEMICHRDCDGYIPANSIEGQGKECKYGFAEYLAYHLGLIGSPLVPGPECPGPGEYRIKLERIERSQEGGDRP